MVQQRRLSIIGVGPRGGYALERLVIELSNENNLSHIHFLLFERTGNFGNGQVYTLHQNSSNWINITERALALDRREVIQIDELKIDSFPSYHEWADKDFDSMTEEEKDTFPPRAQVGDYLSQRFQSLVRPLIQANLAALYEEEVEEIEWLDNGQFQIITDQQTHEAVDEVLLTIGHQATELDEQLVNWSQFATDKKGIHLFKNPYPTSSYLHHEALNANSIVGIRGFGLAMIDVVRAIAEKFGTFTVVDEKTQRCEYEAEQTMNSLMVPFSLTGLPPAPKPLNAQIDSWFKPSEAAILAFERQIGNKSIQKEAKSTRFLIDAFSPIAARVYQSLPNNNDNSDLSASKLKELIGQWLEDQSFKHPTILSTEKSTAQMMQAIVGMAIGEHAISLDYCIGQVWRHCQPSIYDQLSYNECADDVFGEIIKLDESTKRYSYGPPVESLQQLLALAKVGILNLNFTADPDIELTEKGWQFTASEQSITANFMIDSILAAPKIKVVKSNLVKDLLSEDMMKAVHDDFGVLTDDNGYLIPRKEKKAIPIALLGRLAKGTVIGVDAILECFGPRPRQWAKQSANHHKQWLAKHRKPSNRHEAFVEVL